MNDWHFRLTVSEKIAVAMLAALLAFVAGTALFQQLDPHSFHEELRILYHLDPVRSNSKDYVGNFLGNVPQPLLYSFITKIALAAGMDFSFFHRLLGVACSLALLSGVWYAGKPIGGAFFAATTTVFVAAQPFYYYQTGSATPHAFAFPLLIWALVALLHNRLYMLTAVTALSGFLYPPISPVIGLALAWHFVVARKGLGRQNPNRIKEALMLAAVAVVTLLLLLYQLTPVGGYGAGVVPGTQVDMYPENGPDGRHFFGVFNPISYVLVGAIGQFNEALPVALIVILPMCIAAVAGLGLYYLRERPGDFQALLSVIIPSMLFCILIVVLRPYVAYRFLLYPLFVVVPFLFVYGLFTLSYEHRSTLRQPAAVVVVIIIPLALALTGNTGHRSFSPLKLEQSGSSLMQYIEELPQESLIAAWPNGNQTSLIPYVAGRPLLVDYKAHYPIYEGYIAIMRARMYSLIDAYLAVDRDPLIELRCRWQVDYLVVDQVHFSADEVQVSYFAPFDDRIKEVLQAAGNSELILRDPPKEAVVYGSGRFQVLDLALLAGDTDCQNR